MEKDKAVPRSSQWYRDEGVGFVLSHSKRKRRVLNGAQNSLQGEHFSVSPCDKLLTTI